jgi:hypothetical protein
MQYLVTSGGRGRELTLGLRKELGVPESATGFTVHFNGRDVIRVDCSFLPVDRSECADVTPVGEMVSRWQAKEPQA